MLNKMTTLPLKTPGYTANTFYACHPRDSTVLDLAQFGGIWASKEPDAKLRERSTGFLTITYTSTGPIRALADHIIDHMLLWEWEGASIAHRRLGILWLIIELSLLSVHFYADDRTKPIAQALTFYLEECKRVGMDTGKGTWNPLRDNYPYDPEKLVTVGRNLEALNFAPTVNSTLYYERVRSTVDLRTDNIKFFEGMFRDHPVGYQPDLDLFYSIQPVPGHTREWILQVHGTNPYTYKGPRLYRGDAGPTTPYTSATSANMALLAGLRDVYMRLPSTSIV